MIAVTTVDGIRHLLESREAISRITSPNTRAALQAACDEGHWQPYTPPVPLSEPLLPDWSAFRIGLQQSVSFRLWSETLPATWREDLKMAALVGNAEALQDTYNHCKKLRTPGHTTAASWQQIAVTNRIPVTF